MGAVTVPLVVLLGAGASYDCASENVARDWPRPPLVIEMFEAPYDRILDNYPVARHAGSEIRYAIHRASDEGRSIALEQFIKHRFQEAATDEDRRKHLALPWYLQELLWKASRTYTRNPDNIDLLVAHALRTQRQVAFVTLNYDTILDDVLTAVGGPLDQLEQYADPDRRWSLIKLHGSVDWGFQIYDPTFTERRVTVPTFALKEISSEISIRRGSSITEVRLQAVGAQWYYPALSVPVGGDLRLANCPPEHVAALRELLRRAESIDLLVIGYSGLDTEALELLGACSVRSLRLVIGPNDEARPILDRFAKALSIACEPVVSSAGFSTFAQRGELEGYFAGLSD